MSGQTTREFMYLFERMSEPLGYGIKGSGNSMVYYNTPNIEVSVKDAIDKQMMGQSQEFRVQRPSKMPMQELAEISQLCPKSGLFGYFIPGHRKALNNLKKLFLDQRNRTDLYNMASFCRDSKMVHPHLFIHALSSCMATRKDTKGFDMPAFYEVMPEIFFTDHVMKQAEKMARMPDKCKSIIMVDRNTTGHQNDPESRLWYFREDIGVNSHHFHWHVVFPGDYVFRMESKRDRRGELFYYMHHSMIARYDAERLSNGLSRTKLFDFDNLVIEEGYFGKLYSTNAGRHWGTRQANTKLQNLVGKTDNDPSPNALVWDLKIEELKRWRDRILEAIDTGIVIQRRNNQNEKKPLDEETGIDVLGDIIENSDVDTPHAQFYGAFGFHNMGHLLIACAHDPNGNYREFFGPMGDTSTGNKAYDLVSQPEFDLYYQFNKSTAMRDPVFYRWHKYIDDMFDIYKRTLEPYKLDSGKWPLKWNGVNVLSIEVKNTNPKFQQVKNTLSTFWMMSDVELSRGLDFHRTEMANGGAVRARITHLNYDLFSYIIRVNNTSGRSLPTTVRIFMAPRMNEHGESFSMNVQRLLFFELDKFSYQLMPGSNTIERSSLDSSVTIKMENSFRQLEQLNNKILRDDVREEKDKGRCGCGWPQNLLLPKGTSGSGLQFDLFVMLTDGQKDTIMSNGPKKQSCKDAMSFCGIIDEKYPDPRPMGYPFDRLPYDNPSMQGSPVSNLDEYVTNINNAKAITVKIIHDIDRKIQVGSDDERDTKGMGMVSENGEVLRCTKNDGDTGPKQLQFPNRGPPSAWHNSGVNYHPAAFSFGNNHNKGTYRGNREDDHSNREDWDWLDNMEN